MSTNSLSPTTGLQYSASSSSDSERVAIVNMEKSTTEDLFDPLPDEIILNIFRFLTCWNERNSESFKEKLMRTEYTDRQKILADLAERYADLKNCTTTCTRLRRIASNVSLWKPLIDAMYVDLEKLNSEQQIYQQIKMVHLHAKEFIYPFDELIAKIERAIDTRIADALGWKLIYAYQFTQNAIYRHLASIESEEFRLSFSRIQGIQGALEGRWNDTAGGVCSIVIPMLKYSAEKDFSGEITVYFGKQWEKDNKEFFESSKEDQERPPAYLHYKPCVHNNREEIRRYSNKKPSQFFVREAKYSNQVTPVDQPHFYESIEIFRRITEYLDDKVWKQIESSKKKEPEERDC